MFILQKSNVDIIIIYLNLKYCLFLQMKINKKRKTKNLTKKSFTVEIDCNKFLAIRWLSSNESAKHQKIIRFSSKEHLLIDQMFVSFKISRICNTVNLREYDAPGARFTKHWQLSQSIKFLKSVFTFWISRSWHKIWNYEN